MSKPKLSIRERTILERALVIEAPAVPSVDKLAEAIAAHGASYQIRQASGGACEAVIVFRDIPYENIADAANTALCGALCAMLEEVDRTRDRQTTFIVTEDDDGDALDAEYLAIAAESEPTVIVAGDPTEIHGVPDDEDEEVREMWLTHYRKYTISELEAAIAFQREEGDAGTIEFAAAVTVLEELRGAATPATTFLHTRSDERSFEESDEERAARRRAYWTSWYESHRRAESTLRKRLDVLNGWIADVANGTDTERVDDVFDWKVEREVIEAHLVAMNDVQPATV